LDIAGGVCFVGCFFVGVLVLDEAAADGLLFVAVVLVVVAD
jgi:hypothetical protein